MKFYQMKRISFFPLVGLLFGFHTDFSEVQAQTMFDKNGILCPLADNLVQFKFAGDCKILAVDDGDLADHYHVGDSMVYVLHGRAVLYIQSNGNQDNLELLAESEGLLRGSVRIRVEQEDKCVIK